MGDITFTLQRDWTDDKGQRNMTGKCQMSATYATGGESLSIGNEFRQVRSLKTIPLEDSGGYRFQVDDTQFDAPTTAIKVEAYRGDYDAGADGALIEVTAGVSLSAVYFNVHIIGLAA